LDLIRECAESFLIHYPQGKLLFIDNGSQDASTDYIIHVSARHKNANALLNDHNLFHGPAMDQGIRFYKTPFVFLLDSDCRIFQSRFLEEMRHQLQVYDAHATGRLQYKNKLGYDLQQLSSSAIRYIDPHAMLLRRSSYRSCPPLIHHGAPCLDNMKTATKQECELIPFPVGRHICQHLGRGTCASYGYGLGWRSRVEYWLQQVFNW
jgi:glycosyltransferase involved in cell wall biosynthesis